VYHIESWSEWKQTWVIMGTNHTELGAMIDAQSMGGRWPVRIRLLHHDGTMTMVWES